MAAVGGLEQIEKDIMLCEQFLSSDKFANGVNSKQTPIWPCKCVLHVQIYVLFHHSR